MDLSASIEILQKYWGYPAFRDGQDRIVESILSGNDTLALLPTGGGKSICYQVPGLQSEGVCLVISPLIALMHDQVANLKNRGIKAIAITSAMSKKQIDIQLDNAVYGDIKFVYVSPERLKTHLFIARIKKMKVNLIAVDEAHCISQWGYDFRPAYLDIAELRKIKPDVPILALTATATPQVVEDIQDKLAFKRPNAIRRSFFRENLVYSTISTPNKKNRISEYVRQHDGSGIIYCATRKNVKELCAYLYHQDIAVDFYHAGLDFETRRERQENWLKEKTRVMISTNAFGMGIDKPNVRFVLHYDIPETPEAYFQEAGRAGRDGKPAEAILFYEEADLRRLVEKVHAKFPPLETIKQIYNALGNHLQLAFGAGKDEHFPIDLAAFSDKYKQPLITVYNALKFMESAGYIELSEGMNRPSMLKIIAGQLELYQEQVRDPFINTLIQFILRTHMGIFDDYVNINEYLIAKKINASKKAIIEKLQYLAKLELVDYIPQNNEPQITYLTERLPDSNLTFAPRFYHDRKETGFEKMKAMMGFLESGECRSVLLLRYFGEDSSSPCGKCASCKASKQRGSAAYFEIKNRLVMELETAERLETEWIASLFPGMDRQYILEILRMLADQRIILLDETGRIVSRY